MNRKRISKVSLLIVLLLLSIGIGSAAASGDRTHFVTLTFDGLPDLGEGWAYEGWAIVNDQPVSTGTFTVDEEGTASQATFSFTNATRPKAYVLTIEPNPDPDPAPSETHILAGDFYGRHARLRAGHGAALGDDFKDASGSFILAAPSDPAAPYTQGIWCVVTPKSWTQKSTT